MDPSAADPEPFFHLSSGSRRTAEKPPAAADDKPSFNFLADDVVLPSYEFQQQQQQQQQQHQRRNESVDQGSSSRHHRSSGSPVYLTGELYPARKERDVELHEQLIVSAVERTIKKYADNILKFLEGMSGRLSQLESVTHVLEHSVTSLKASVDEYHAEADVKLRSLNDHIREMHRGVQILRDRQDIIETQAELAKLQASKQEALVEKTRAVTNESPVPPQTTMTEDPSSALVLKTMPSNQSHVSPLQTNDATRQMSLSSGVNTLPQQYIVAQQPQGQLQPELQAVHVHNQQTQGLQAYAIHGSVQQYPQQQSQPLQHTVQLQTSAIQQQSEPQVQNQVMTQQQMHMHQPSAMAQTSLQSSNIQYASSSALQTMIQPQQVQRTLPNIPQSLPTQNIGQPQQIQGTFNPQMQAHHLPQGMPSTPQTQLQQSLPLQHNAQAQLQDAYQLAHQKENKVYSSLPPVSSPQVGYGSSVKPYTVANAIPLPQHQNPTGHMIQSPQQITNVAPYQRNSPVQYSGGQPVYAPQVSSVSNNARTLAVAQTVYNEGSSGGGSSALSHDGIIEKGAAMGFSRDQVRSVIRGLTDRGQSVDMNSVLDILMNGGNQPPRAWSVR